MTHARVSPRSYIRWLSILLATGLLVGCGSVDTERAQGAPSAKTSQMSPDRLWGPVMKEVAMRGLYADGKTVVDLVPERNPQAIVEDFQRLQAEGPISDQRLQAFVDDNFHQPPENEKRLSEPANTPIAEHIRNLWPYLTRDPEQIDVDRWSSLVALPHRYVVPGGRFNEMFYWDSYFTMLGLAESGRYDLVRDMVDNFAWLIDTYGFIPNGTRTYFLTRSQPPYFALMVRLLASHEGDEVYTRYLPELQREYDWWMRGADHLEPGEASEHVVRLADGTLFNRYFGGENQPRPEAYAAELETAAQSERPASEVYGHLRAAAESGWDFSSRWLADDSRLATIETRDIVPVDLNSLMVCLEQSLAHGWQLAGQPERAETFRQRAEQHREAINRWLWNDEGGYYVDYNWRQSRQTDAISAAMVYPLFFDIAGPERSQQTAQAIRRYLLRPGGLVTTNRESGEQWDAPNGWAPLQWMAVDGLSRHGQPQLAETIARRWVATNRTVYDQTGKLVEKYNVEQPGVGGGGEYDVVDGFGWTNGVLLKLLARYPTLEDAKSAATTSAVEPATQVATPGAEPATVP